MSESSESEEDGHIENRVADGANDNDELSIDSNESHNQIDSIKVQKAQSVFSIKFGGPRNSKASVNSEVCHLRAEQGFF